MKERNLQENVSSFKRIITITINAHLCPTKTTDFFVNLIGSSSATSATLSGRSDFKDGIVEVEDDDDSEFSSGGIAFT